MPELPEVETTRRGIAPHIVGEKVAKLVVRNDRLRWPIPKDLASTIKGEQLRSLTRRGKYLLLEFQAGYVLWHLGMSGSLRVLPPGQQPSVQTHEHVDLCMANGVVLRFHDPRRFGAVLWANHPVFEHDLLSHLGPEPLSEDFDWQYLYQKSRKRKQPIKTFVMDSKVVVGVGNIYANEALFAAGIRPTKPAGKLTKAQAEILEEEIKKVLARAIEQGGTTLKDFIGGDGKPGYFAQQLNVYGRGNEPCVNCQKPLKEIRMGNRTTVYCSQCQS